MFPSAEQIRVAAYHRWQRGGWTHGHDLDDWSTAEQDLLFALNYDVVAHYRLDGVRAQFLGDKKRRVCRFCEQAAPRTTFTDPAPTLPESVGNTALFAYDACDECRELFREGIEADFEAFRRTVRSGLADGRPALERPGPRPYVPIAAFKCLTKMALSILPAAELEYVPDAIEWVLNPDHRLDSGSLGGLGGYLHFDFDSPGAPWAAVARRIEEETPFPYLLFFLGAAEAIYEIPVPLCVRDEDNDGLIVPRVASPDSLARGRGEVRCAWIPMSSADARRGTATTGA
jgi:hypothetical protein